jgi:cytochrome P450
VGNAPAPHAVVHGRNRQRYVCADVANNILPFQDPPEHSLPRKLIGKTFLDHLKGQGPDIERIAREKLAPGMAAGRFDLLADFATPFSVSVLARFLGVPEADESQLKIWAEWFFYLFFPLPSVEARNELDLNLGEFRAWFSALIEARRAQPADDLVSALIAARSDGLGLTDDQLIDTCMLLFADGVENVDKLIATAVALLVENPLELASLRTDPSLLPAAVDECLRYESPAQSVGKVAREDIALHGQVIKKHSGMLLLLGSANRDPRQFPDADRFQIRRESNAYLSFGKGRHACIGGSLVRLELETALRVLLDTLPALELEEESLQWRPRQGHRWLESLHVKCLASR